MLKSEGSQVSCWHINSKPNTEILVVWLLPEMSFRVPEEGSVKGSGSWGPSGGLCQSQIRKVCIILHLLILLPLSTQVLKAQWLPSCMFQVSLKIEQIYTFVTFAHLPFVCEHPPQFFFLSFAISPGKMGGQGFRILFTSMLSGPYF